ncbi:growth hormone secretagogue receptor type 1 [Lingula anatina]|uniref:Growth hormone secretagogue receptor type 1 n=1 Tax=Lingula anatina TaxID=7574 RepID=A0A1S3ITW7_LINAN|nr:growth hormone secretagogue receptor type 1 [Lingula anatina]|eukprot:XP_013401650.1 growth hormone secretagogue receptor type 1 [Lingula anatina]
MDVDCRMPEAGIAKAIQELNATSAVSTFDNLTNETETWNEDFFNISTNISRVVPEVPKYILITATSFYIIMFLLGLTGNMLVVYVVLRNRDMHSSTHLFLVNLSLADLLVLVICMPTALIDLHAKDVWLLGEGLCKLVPFLENCTALTSTLTILTVSFDRYYGICQPLRARTVKMLRRSHVCILVTIIWIVAIAICIPFTLIPVYRNSKFKDGTPIKVCRNTIKDSWKTGYIIFVFCFFFVVPFFILVVIYSIITRQLSRESFQLRGQHEQAARVRLRTRKQVITMLIVIVFLFFLFHLPIRVVSLWVVYASKEEMEALGLEGYYNLLAFARIMFYLHCATNPIVYNVVSTKFRMATAKVFCSRQQLELSQKRSSYSRQFSRSLSNRSNKSDSSCVTDRMSIRTRSTSDYVMYKRNEHRVELT